MKFDFVIGNPPYQDSVQDKGDRASPIYDKFMDAAFGIADVVLLIHPARFLFDAGQTPKAWNRKMLNDEHFRVLQYEQDSSVYFPSVDIKGGIAISVHNSLEEYGCIGTFSAFPEMNAVIRKVSEKEKNGQYLSSIIASQGLYRFSPLFFDEHPEAKSQMGAGTGNKIVSSVMEKLPDIFLAEEPAGGSGEYVRMMGRIKGRREYRYIRRSYLCSNDYLDTYNLFIPEANNTGSFGETLTEPAVGRPGEGAADTYLSAGTFGTAQEAENMARYMRTRFFRALLGVKKVTQHCPPTVWTLIPVQDFTGDSDIDWNLPVDMLDQQLCDKYNISEEERLFLKTHVKPMA